jgi:hypothetical protein
MYDIMEVGENKFLQRLEFWCLGGGFTVGIMNNRQMYRCISRTFCHWVAFYTAHGVPIPWGCISRRW